MKNILKLFFLISVLLQCNFALSQFKDPVDEGMSSIAIQPPNQFISPPGTESNTITIDGFDNFDLGIDFGEPYIATNPRDPFNSICAFNINNLYYTLNGYDWTKVVVSFPGYNVIGDPVLTFDSLGVAIYCQLYQNGNVYGLVINKSTNKGVSWSGVSSVWGTAVGLSDKEWIAADQTAGPYSNYVYACWRQFGASGMRFVRSTDRGVSWSSPMTFTGGQGAYVSVGANSSVQGGSVYFASLSGGSVLVNRSIDGGATFSDQLVASTFPAPGIFCAGRNTVKS